MYKLVYEKNVNAVVCVLRISDGTFISLSEGNSDYLYFKQYINEEKCQLQDADGNLMTPEEAKAFVSTLP